MMWLLLLCFLGFADVPAEARAENDSLLLMFWNVENFFDTEDGGGGRSDAEFTPDGARRWTKKRFYAKCNAVASTVLAAAETYGRVPDLLALAEVENRSVLQALAGGTLLRKLGYRILHYDSPDRRGIDCALLYRNGRLTPLCSSPRHLFAADGSVLRTRDILLAEFPGIDVLVNHHPSKVGGASGDRRAAAMARMRFLCDSLQAAGHPAQLCVGDFNDDVWGGGGEGTIKYNGSWEKIDGHFAFGRLRVRETVFRPAFLREPDKAFGGWKPRRTYVGPAYRGGVSDHYPVICEISCGF